MDRPDRRSRRAALTSAAVSILMVIAASACGRAGGLPAPYAPDGSARRPDAEGVVTAVSFTSLTLDGSRSYKVPKNVAVFSSESLQPVPLLQRKGQYVHVGVSGTTVRWVAAVGRVVDGPPSVVYYVGRVSTAGGDAVTFSDGTVEKALPGVTAGVAVGATYIAEIDPSAHAVRTMRRT